MAASAEETDADNAAAADTGRRSLKWRTARARAGRGCGRGVRSRPPSAAAGRGGGADCSHGRHAGTRRAREGEGRIRRSCDVAVGGFILVTLGCWFHCRYNYAKLRIQERVAREGIKNKILYESTHLDPERKTNGSGSSH
uniref:Cytochrome c oxidase assembly protein COX20, mitochondrial n=1 Tax=Sus scrofa TaxID=9823 RepID=A0A8D1ITF4_PIG